MTIREAFIHKAGNGISDDDAITLLSFEGIDPETEWDAKDKTMRCSFYGALLRYLSGNEGSDISSISEGGYSIRYSDDGKKERLSRLANESGCKDLIDAYTTVPVIQNKSMLW